MKVMPAQDQIYAIQNAALRERDRRARLEFDEPQKLKQVVTTVSEIVADMEVEAAHYLELQHYIDRLRGALAAVR